AQARLVRLQAGARPEEVAAAQAVVDAAKAALAGLQAGASEDELAAARAELRNAEASLRLAQAAYDPLAYRGDAGMLPQAAALEQATNAYEVAKARLSALTRGPRATQVEAAQADVRRAEAQLALLQADARAEDVAVAEAEVAAAWSALQMAEAALREVEVRAPFAGTVAALDVRVGEQALPGVALVQLADTSAWEIETEDLTELAIADVVVGAPVTVTFDALPDLTLPGKVARIRSYGERRQGDIVYTVGIVLDRQDPRLRWNMTAAVAIHTP
ncbi:MAG: HlyD family secretion protein, partial [Anaerolineae bacterium]